jgi:hypothetical protein
MLEAVTMECEQGQARCGRYWVDRGLPREVKKLRFLPVDITATLFSLWRS